MMIEEGPRYARSAECAATIVNLLGGAYPGGKAQLYARVLYLILDAMYRAEAELNTSRLAPSEN